MMKSLSLAFLVSVSATSWSAVDRATAQLTSPKDAKMKADVNFVETDKGIVISSYVSGLKPKSVHGFHIHEKGECKGPDFKSAGEHFNPTSGPHNGPAAPKKHIGDLGNLVANDQGVAKSEVFIPVTEVKEMKVFVGKSIIIHDKADDLQTQPSGNSGDRIACGVIKEI